jgi:1,4-alpha-glucan branching enzyme
MASNLEAQVTIHPFFPSDTDSITVTFDASKGNGDLKDIAPPVVYMHTGVITDKSSSPTDWKYVQGNWGQADARVLMTYQGNNIYTKKYHLRNFYGVPIGEEILRLAFVFRNAGGSKVGRATDDSDIFVDLPDGYALKILTPVDDHFRIQLTDSIVIQAAVSEKSSFKLYHNQTLVTQTTQDTTVFDYIYRNPSVGSHFIKIEANNGSETLVDSFFYLIHQDKPRKDPTQMYDDGVTFISDSVTRFTLYAPQKNYVYLLGDFNNWQLRTEFLMNKSLDGSYYWLDVKGLTADQQYAYQYAIDAERRVADPYSSLVLDPWNDKFISSGTFPNLHPYPDGQTTGIVSLFTAHPTTSFDWKVNDFTPAAKEDLVIYELLVRDFLAAHNYQTLLDTLDYLENLGINAIEFMPVSEFEGNESWGYNPSFHMALDKYYGTPEAFKTLVDECHRRGIAVILDVVYNHAFSQSPLCQLYWDDANFRPASNSPYANVTEKHPFNVGYDLNHESKATQYWLDRMNRYWIEEYHVDGFRYDLSKGFTQQDANGDVGKWGQYDASRIALLKRMANVVWSYKSDALLILEHFADNSEEKELGSHGFMLWGNINHDFGEASLGYASNLNWSSYKSRGHNQPDWVVYAESHDEERIMYKNLQFGNNQGGYSIKNLATALDRVELYSCFLYGLPGPKMLWQFGEVGYDVNIDFNGRVGNKPIKWEYFTDQDRRDVYTTISELIKLKTTYPSFKTTNFNAGLSGFAKYIQLIHDDMDVLIVGNFDVKLVDINTPFPHTGMWYEYFTGDSVNAENVNVKMAYSPGEYRIYTDKKITPSSKVGVDDLGKNKPMDLKLYPNPTDGRFSIINTRDQHLKGVLNVSDLSGRTVHKNMEVDLAPYSHFTPKIDLNPGIYLIEVYGQSGEKSTGRLVVH